MESYAVKALSRRNSRQQSGIEGALMTILRSWLWLTIFVIPLTTSVSRASVDGRQVSANRENRVWRSLGHSTEFAEVPHTSAPDRCEDTRPPEALTTPSPLTIPSSAGSEIKVSFIVGTDGHVHSPLILKSAGPVGDRNVLQAVRAWRYRPATCNGVPTEAEGRIGFSRR